MLSVKPQPLQHFPAASPHQRHRRPLQSRRYAGHLSPRGAVVSNFHLPMLSKEVKNRSRQMQIHKRIFSMADVIVTPTTSCSYTISNVCELSWSASGDRTYKNIIINGAARSSSQHSIIKSISFQLKLLPIRFCSSITLKHNLCVYYKSIT
ncbi:hypothetical protein Droror1_Dr00024441 [Drosera rotundifolia]